jgi:hypothetical protein
VVGNQKNVQKSKNEVLFENVFFVSKNEINYFDFKNFRAHFFSKISTVG